MTWQVRLIAGLLAVAGVVGGWWRLTAHYEAKGAASEREKWKAQAQALTERNRDLQRAAELRYVVLAEGRDRFITNTITEVRYVTQHLDACPVGAPAVRLLNAASACARSDSAATCGPDQPVPRAP